MTDAIVTIGNSLIQHGKLNDRIYLIKLDLNDVENIIFILNKLAIKNNYSKIFAKVPSEVKNLFIKDGYTIEAEIPQFYNGVKDVYFISKYYSPQRAYNNDKEITKNILEKAFLKDKKSNINELKKGFSFFQCIPKDATEMGKLYSIVFKTYPFPIYDPGYIVETMNKNIEYYGVRQNDTIVALASSEKDIKAQNTEMTDFATLPEFRGNGFAINLLFKMEKFIKSKNIKLAYTIARSNSIGMNFTFASLNYKFAGTLINNTCICGKLENMNVWYKSIN